MASAADIARKFTRRNADASTSSPTEPAVDPWPPQARVVVELVGEIMTGRVAFATSGAEGDWIYWCDERPPHAVHATPSRFVRRLS